MNSLGKVKASFRAPAIGQRGSERPQHFTGNVRGMQRNKNDAEMESVQIASSALSSTNVTLFSTFMWCSVLSWTQFLSPSSWITYCEGLNGPESVWVWLLVEILLFARVNTSFFTGEVKHNATSAPKMTTRKRHVHVHQYITPVYECVLTEFQTSRLIHSRVY